MGGHIESFNVDQRRRGLLASTIRRREYSLRALGRTTGTDLLALTTAELEAFLDGRRLTARSRYAWISNLHAFYEWAQRAGRVDADPTAEIIRPRLRRTLPRPIADEDLALALRSAAPDRRAALMLAAYAGLRCGEIARLERDEIDERAATLRIVGKGGHERVVPMRPDVAEALRAMGLPRAGRVFRRDAGGGFTGEQMSRWLNTFLQSTAGIDASAHQLRHWFGSRAYEECRDLRVVQELLGHASPTTTAVYTAFSPVVQTEAVLRLPAVGTLR